MNMMRAQKLGWGVRVEFSNLTYESLSWAINEVLENPQYTFNVKEIANRLKDQPQTPMEKAIFWIEYILRHDGAEFMKTSARHLNSVEYNNIDIYAVFLLIALIAIFTSIIIVKISMKQTNVFFIRMKSIKCVKEKLN